MFIMTGFCVGLQISVCIFPQYRGTELFSNKRFLLRQKDIEMTFTLQHSIGYLHIPGNFSILIINCQWKTHRKPQHHWIVNVVACS